MRSRGIPSRRGRRARRARSSGRHAGVEEAQRDVLEQPARRPGRRPELGDVVLRCTWRTSRPAACAASAKAREERDPVDHLEDDVGVAAQAAQRSPRPRAGRRSAASPSGASQALVRPRDLLGAGVGPAITVTRWPPATQRDDLAEEDRPGAAGLGVRPVAIHEDQDVPPRRHRGGATGTIAPVMPARLREAPLHRAPWPSPRPLGGRARRRSAGRRATSSTRIRSAPRRRPEPSTAGRSRRPPPSRSPPSSGCAPPTPDRGDRSGRRARRRPRPRAVDRRRRPPTLPPHRSTTSSAVALDRPRAPARAASACACAGRMSRPLTRPPRPPRAEETEALAAGLARTLGPATSCSSPATSARARRRSSAAPPARSACACR